MQYLSDIGFVVKRIQLGEADRFLTIFTRKYGKQEVLAKGVRKITSRRASHIELLNLIKFQSVKTSKNYILTEVELLNSFQPLKKDLSTINKCFFICELVEKLCPYGQRHEDVFDLMLTTLEHLKNEPYESSVLFDFQVQLLSTLGFWDGKRKFRDTEDLKNFIESIIERKIKTRILL